MNIKVDKLMSLCSVYTTLDVELAQYKDILNNMEVSDELKILRKKSLIEAYGNFKKYFPKSAIKKYPYINTLDRLLKKD